MTCTEDHRKTIDAALDEAPHGLLAILDAALAGTPELVRTSTEGLTSDQLLQAELYGRVEMGKAIKEWGQQMLASNVGIADPAEQANSVVMLARTAVAYASVATEAAEAHGREVSVGD